MKGQLSLQVAAPSQLLADTWSFEVRDARMRRIRVMGRHEQLDLDPGLYRVSAVLEDGREYEDIVEVRAGEQSVAHFAAQPSPVRSAEHAGLEPQDLGLASIETLLADNVRSAHQDHFFARADAIGRLLHPPRNAPDARVEPGPDVRLVKNGARRWSVHALQAGAHWARLVVGTEAWLVSLPTVLSGDGSASVDLELCGDGTDWRPRARIAAWRTVAHSLQQLLGEHQMERAFAVADRATMLLAEKYQDPVGAILGALLLHRMRRLHTLRNWLDNLAQHCSYWSDAVILSALLDGESTDREQRERGLNVLLNLDLPRACFSESHSLRLDALRRWPDETRLDQRSVALVALNARFAEIDWDALSFTHHV